MISMRIPHARGRCRASYWSSILAAFWLISLAGSPLAAQPSETPNGGGGQEEGEPVQGQKDPTPNPSPEDGGGGQDDAASPEDGGGGFGIDAEESTGETVILAFVGAAPTVRIDWTPKAEGARGMTALASVEAEQEVFIDEGVTRTRTLLVYSISRAELTSLEIDVPGDQKVAGVFDANVRQWGVEKVDVEKGGDRQRITVDLFQPATTTQPLRVELEQFRAEGQAADVVVPVIHARAVGRQQGVITVVLAPGLRGQTAQRVGVTQLDRSDLPPRLAKRPSNFAYRFARTPFDLALAVEKVEPEIETDSLAELYVEPQQLLLELFAVYHVERAGIYELAFDVPADFEVEDVRGHATKGVEAAAVDSYHREGDDNTRLRVNLAKKALGRVGVVVVCRRRLDDPNLQRPTGESSTYEIALSRVNPADVGRARGQAVVYAPESLRVIPSDDPRLRSVSLAEATGRIPSGRNGRYAHLAPVMSFAFSHDKTREPESLELVATRRKPNIAVQQLLVAGIDTGEIRYTATFRYNIRYSGVESLVIAIPAEIAGKVRNDSVGIRDEVVAGADGSQEGLERSQGPQALAPSPPNRSREPSPTSKPSAANDLGERARVRGQPGSSRNAAASVVAGDTTSLEPELQDDEVGSPSPQTPTPNPSPEDGGGGQQSGASPENGGGGPEDGGGGEAVLWKFTGETEFLGDVTIRLAWEVPAGGLDVGKSVEFIVPRLDPVGVNRSRGQIVLTKTETIDIVPAGEPAGLNPIDPQTDLFEGTSVKNAARAFEFHDDWSLVVKATQYQLEEVKRTSIDRAVVRAVVTRNDQVAVQSLYRMRSAQQRLEIQLPAAVEPGGIAFDTDPLRINGRPVTLERGGDSRSFFVPLVGIDSTESFVLELRYTMPGSYRQIDLASFPGDPAVQKVHLCVYVPDELAYLGSRGPWTESLEWDLAGTLRWEPRAASSDDELIRELTDGFGRACPSAEMFPTDGKLLLFTAVRPEDPPEGALRITAMSRRRLSGLVFGVVAIFGVALTRRRFSTRILGLGLLAVVVFLLGVFLPTFARQIIGGSLWLALALVVFIWVVVGVSHWRPVKKTFVEKRDVTANTENEPAETPNEAEPTKPPAADEPAEPQEGGTTDA